jgi:SAM-dependent methyltransferase
VSVTERILDRVHGRYVHGRRVRVLRERLLETLPEKGSLLDVGCGDGKLARAVIERRPTLHVTGIDVHVRPDTEIPVAYFNGTDIPFADLSFDVVMFVDVLHHVSEPERLLLEARRVARQWVVIKDHLCESAFDFSVLRFMDWVGNARHGVSLPHNYWSGDRWIRTFAALDLPIESWRTDVGLYPWPASALFDRGLHFVAKLTSRQHVES